MTSTTQTTPHGGPTGAADLQSGGSQVSNLRTRLSGEATSAPFELDPRLAKMREYLRDGGYKCFRTSRPFDLWSECDAEGLSWMRRTARLTRRMCEAQEPVICPEENIVFIWTATHFPRIYTDAETEAIAQGRKIHERGPISNICPDWGAVLRQGLLGRREVAVTNRERMRDDPEVVEFLDAAIETIDAVLALAARYVAKARRLGRHDITGILEQVPARPPRSFREALQFLRLCHSVLWMSGHYHCGLGRFDQYMWPYLEADLKAGRLTTTEAERLLAEFFLTLNKDSDLYPGIQQGDNGQSLMLGGVTPDNRPAVNPLTYMALRVARGTRMIDPKINLRISPETDIELLELAAQLTEIGLGFPQYANDDIVIPGLIACGYRPEDARNYIVAACWEFAIPGCAMDVVNIGALSMPTAVDVAVREGLAANDSFDGILARVRADMQAQVNKFVDSYRSLLLPPAPWYSVLMGDCLERGRDLSHGLRYNNFGIHGACSANAADALAAVKQFVFDDRTVSAKRLLDALASNFEHDEPLRRMLFDQGPKAGNNDDRADAMLVKLFDLFADACEAVKDNGRGGIVRPGSGSAMYYVWLARGPVGAVDKAVGFFPYGGKAVPATCGRDGMIDSVVGATADGRKAGDLFSSSLAPSPGVKVRGILSVLQSYAKIDYKRICNGGPLTTEVSETVFRNPEALRQVALLIRQFATLGCQQLQINTLNVETLKEAQRHPELHKNLVVRVWGWSAYFCDLNEIYQDHVIARHVFAGVDR